MHIGLVKDPMIELFVFALDGLLVCWDTTFVIVAFAAFGVGHLEFGVRKGLTP